MSLVFPPNKPLGGRQSGAALILALMVVVIVVLVASTMGNDFLVTFRRVENQLHGKQAHAYLRGAEGLARSALQLDFKDSKNKLHASEDQWLNVVQEFALDYGVISGTVCDLQGRFNINNLSGRAEGGAAYTADQQLFIRLLQTLNLNPDSPLDQQQAEEITHALIDWIDVDSEITGSGGAERGYYADLDLPYRPADQALLSVSELRWVKGIDDKLYRSLEPHITALKPGTRININTAGLNVLRSFNEDGNLQPIAEFDAQAIIRDRDGDPEAGTEQMKSGFDDLQAFVSSHPATALNPDSMSVTSEYFLVDSHSVFMGRSYRLYSVLHRGGDGHVKTIARASSGLGACSGNQ